MKLFKNFTLILIVFIVISCGKERNQYEVEALNKIEKLTSLMATAKAKKIDVTREETTLWFSKEFLKFADWDENNKTWRSRPSHDWSSHCADALRYLAVGYQDRSSWGDGPLKRNLSGVA